MVNTDNAVTAGGAVLLVGDRVIRSAGDKNYVGKRGQVVEVDQVNDRLRVLWDGDKRTWVGRRFLAAE